ncbi:MAG: hypothetical protein IPL61_16120 [Myxococcales bacterium]|nr:hypothetical protein [Myxococcales bacterium]
MRRFALILAVAGIALSTSAGCLVRTRTHPAHAQGHPASHRHEHCHDRGGKHHKQVCHSHPHGPGHH